MAEFRSGRRHDDHFSFGVAFDMQFRVGATKGEQLFVVHRRHWQMNDEGIHLFVHTHGCEHEDLLSHMIA